MNESLVADYGALETLLDQIAESSSEACSEREVAELAITHERLARKLASVGIRRVAEVSDRAAFEAVQCRSLGEFVRDRLRVAASKKHLRRVAALAPMHTLTGELMAPRCPATAAAAAAGRVGSEHVDAVLEVIAKIPAAIDTQLRARAEAQLADIAGRFAPKDILRAGTRILAHLDPDGQLHTDRDRARQRGIGVGEQDVTLMSRISGRLDPMTRALWEVVIASWAAPGMNNPDDPHSPTGAADATGIDPTTLRAAADRDTRSAGQRTHDALTAVLRAVIDGGLLGASHRGLPAHIIVSISEQQLRERAGIAHTTTGTDLPLREVIALAANAHMHLSVFDDLTGAPLYYGRTRRLASQAQRFVLFAQYGGCSAPGCPAPFSHTEIHHAHHDWADGGTTDITDLAPACGPHNRAVGHQPGQYQTIKIHTGPDRGRYGWTPNGTTTPPTTNHLHRPDHTINQHAPP